MAPDDDLVLRPLSDGGPGFVAAIAAAGGGDLVTCRVAGPVGEPVTAEFLLGADGTAWIESAAAAGLHLVPPGRRDPTRTTTRGVGELIAAALAGGAGAHRAGRRGNRHVRRRGGPAGCPRRAAGRRPGRRRRGPARLAALDLDDALAAVDGITLEVATDVDVPLLGPRGAAHGFATQKGATPQQVEALEEAMRHWAHLLGRTDAGKAPAVALGAGAGGGIGVAMLRLGAARVPGIATVLEATAIAELLADVDLVLTGEGAFDWQSLRGKAVAGVAAAALARAVPVVVLAGRVDLARREWIAAGVAAAFPAAADPGEDPAEGVARAAARAARTWSRR